MADTTQQSIGQALAAAQRSWKPASLGEVYVRGDGKIIGKVSHGIGDGYHAERNGELLGTYYTESQAKAAVERSCV